MRCFLGHMPVILKHLRRRWVIVSIVALGSVKFNLVVNMKTAKRLGITIPGPVLYIADEVIK